VVVGHWDKYASGRLDLAAAGAATNMALLLAKDLEEIARTTIENIMAPDHTGRERTVQSFSRVLQVNTKTASAIVDSNVYLALYNFILGSPDPSTKTTEDYVMEEKV
jgi:hypothetical protein